MRKRRNLYIGALLCAVFIVAALASFIWTPFDVTKLDIANKFKPPGLPYALGTDHFGRDILSMIMVGARTSIAVALVAVIDELIMRGNDLVFAFPALLIAVMITAVYGPGALNAIVAIGIFNIPVFARLSRAAALSLWQRDFILSARVAGKSGFRISLEHILPNLLNLLIVQGTIQFSLGILAEAGLSYVGLGAQPPTPSWGRMLAESQTFFAFAKHVVIFPGLAIVFMVLGLNLLGDGLRDYFDPKLRRNQQGSELQ